MASVRQQISKAIIKMYQSPLIAFGSFDPQGLGYITFKAFLENQVLSSVALIPDDIKAFFELNNVFKDGIELSFQKFRQLFFPHVTIAGFD